MNKVELIGRFTRDPEVRRNNDKAVAKFSLAVDRIGKTKEADFINCVAFNTQADFIEKWFKKGKGAAIVGRIRTGSYEKDGNTVYTTEVAVESIEFLPSDKAETAPAEKPQAREEQADIYDSLQEIDLPF